AGAVRLVLVVAWRRLGLVLEPAPAPLVVPLEVLQGPAGILEVAEGEHDGGVDRQDPVRGPLVVTGGRRRHDVARGGDHRVVAARGHWCGPPRRDRRPGVPTRRPPPAPPNPGPP